MNQNTKLTAALVIACAALALSVHGALRGPGKATPADGHACVDQQARDQTERLRRALAERDVAIAGLARSAAAPAASSPSTDPAASSPSRSPPSSPPTESSPRYYAHFEVPDPAVTVTQKPNGTYDIRTTDPKLSGTTIKITAVTQTGDEETLFIRIP
jgi:hypothetical protein